MIALGSDPGLAHLGLAVVQHLPGRQPRILAWAHSVSPPGQSVRAAIRSHRNQVEALIIRWKPTLLGVEEQARAGFGKSQRGQSSFSATDGILVAGVLIGTALCYGCQYREVSPQRAKISVLGKGAGTNRKGGKAELKAAVLRLFEFEGGAPSPSRFASHVADAAANAYAAILLERADWPAQGLGS